MNKYADLHKITPSRYNKNKCICNKYLYKKNLNDLPDLEGSEICDIYEFKNFHYPYSISWIIKCKCGQYIYAELSEGAKQNIYSVVGIHEIDIPNIIKEHMRIYYEWQNKSELLITYKFG